MLSNGFSQGSWNKRFSSWDKIPREEDLKEYAYKLYKANAGYYRPFIVGASVFTQEYIDYMTDLEYRIFLEALDDRVLYESNHALPRRIIL